MLYKQKCCSKLLLFLFVFNLPLVVYGSYCLRYSYSGSEYVYCSSNRRCCPGQGCCSLSSTCCFKTDSQYGAGCCGEGSTCCTDHNNVRCCDDETQYCCVDEYNNAACCEKEVKSDFIVGETFYIIAISLLALLILFAVFFWCVRYRRQHEEGSTDRPVEENIDMGGILGPGLPRYTPPPKYEDIPSSAGDNSNRDTVSHHSDRQSDPAEGRPSISGDPGYSENIYEDATIVENIRAAGGPVGENADYCVPDMTYDNTTHHETSVGRGTI